MARHVPQSVRVAVGMSGGVDSTMAAWLLRQQGFEVVGLTMQIWDGSIPLPDAGRSGCYGPGESGDIEMARLMAGRLGIRHVIVPLASEYRACVLDYFRREYISGRTPNPCVVCNRHIKFGSLLTKARQAGVEFDRFATGHYARVKFDEGRDKFLLLRGADRTKDQSYFLSRLGQDQLRHLLLPLGEMTKLEVVAKARKLGFGELAAKPESQDFFEGEDRQPLFHGAEARPGPIVDEHGHVVGQHRGLIHYTVGQRAGLGIAARERLYVKKLDSETNTVVVAPRTAVVSASCLLDEVEWVSGEPAPDGIRCEVCVRYRHPGVSACVRLLNATSVRVEFEEPQFAVAPGQAGVLYDGDQVLGCGWIRSGC